MRGAERGEARQPQNEVGAVSTAGAGTEAWEFVIRTRGHCGQSRCPAPGKHAGRVSSGLGLLVEAKSPKGGTRKGKGGPRGFGVLETGRQSQVDAEQP